MPISPEPVVLVASEEFTLKSWPVRRTLEQRLIDDLRFALTRDGFKEFRVEKDAARLVVRGVQEAKAAARSCSRIFGVAYAAPATLLPTSMELITRFIVNLANHDLRPGQTFAVRAHRSMPSHVSRREVEVKGGSEILEALKGKDVSVDLDNPDVTFQVDLVGDAAYIYDTKIHGPGGLPISAQWRLLAVLDSGPLTLLAACAMMRRGCLVELFIPTSDTMPGFSSESQLGLARKLRGLVTRPAYRAFTLNMDELYPPPHPDESSQTIRPKELIRGFAAKFAKEKKFKGMILADVAGEVRSPQNVEELPIFAPLIGFDSKDLREIAEFVGVNAGDLYPLGEGETGPQFPVNASSENLGNVKVEQLSL